MTQHWSTINAPSVHSRVDALIVGQSAEIKTLKNLITMVARTRSPVMIQGNTGVGKELAARAVHEASGRKGAFVAVNCAAIPHELLESELFGHEKGAFTGAVQKHIGKFEQAANGTIFLDEIGDMPLDLQSKLLRVLENKTITPVGSNREVPVDFRLVTATHRNIAQHVSKNKFREDLFYRINVFPLTIPTLAERREDIPLILDRMIATYLEETPQATPPHFSQEAVHVLQAHDWPGNVRELRNVLERAFVFFDGALISGEHAKNSLLRLRIPTATSVNAQLLGDEDGAISPAARPAADTVMATLGTSDLRTYLRDIETDIVEMALRETDNNVTQAADMLGLQRTTLVEKLKKLDIQR